jgi:transposase
VKEFSEQAMANETADRSVLAAIPDVKGEMARQAQRDRYAGFVGLDVHKETITVAVAYAGREAPEYRGEIKNTPKAVAKLVRRLSEHGELFLFCYEAGPCGYGLYRQIVEMGHDCEVVAPPKSEQLKTDRRDALRLARLLRAGELTRVWVPDTEQEAMRDLCRCRGDFKVQERKARQQLNGFVLRHGHHWPAGKSRWTQTHYRWLEGLTFERAWQQQVLDEYLAAARAATERVEGLNQALNRALPNWSLAPVVGSLMALRGVDQLSAITLLAELGDISRFDSPRQLMGYLGLVPGLHNSGPRRRSGSITLAGNGHVRRILVESAWSYRFPARQTAHLKRKAHQASDEAKTIAWRAQKRLCGRYRTLVQAGKNTKVVCIAIARELAGFIWDIVRHEMPRVRVA